MNRKTTEDTPTTLWKKIITVMQFIHYLLMKQRAKQHGRPVHSD